MNKKLGFLFVTSVFLVSCGEPSDGILDRLFKGSGSAVPVTVESVSVTERAMKIQVPATLEPSESEDVQMPEDAMIDKILVKVGDFVSQGDPLIKIMRKPTDTPGTKLRAELKDAQTSLEKNLYLLKNRDRLLEEQKIDQAQYDSLEGDLTASEASVEKIKAELAKTPEPVQDKNITSPTSGVVSSISVQAGSQVGPGKVVATVSKTDPINATFRLASYESSTIEPSMPVMIRLPDLAGEGIRGEVTKVDTALSGEDKTFKVSVRAANPKGILKAGMQAEVEFTSPERQRVFIIPSAALIRDRRKHFVFTVLKGVAHKIEVVPNETSSERVEIVKGLRDGDLVVVKGHDKLSEGAVVDIWGR